MKTAFRNKVRWRVKCGKLVNEVYVALLVLIEKTTHWSNVADRISLTAGSIHLGRQLSLPALVPTPTSRKDTAEEYDSHWWPWEPVERVVPRIERACRNHDEGQAMLDRLREARANLESEIALAVLSGDEPEGDPWSV